MTERILSWDVGIKNLAFCMLQKTDDKFTILKWGTINLVEDRQKCQFEMKGGNQCSELAKFCIYHTDKIPLFKDLDSGIGYCCTKHKEKMIPTISEFNKKKKQVPFKCCQCDQEAQYNLDDTDYHWCDEHFKKKGASFIKKIKTKKVTVISCNKQPIQELAEKLYKKLDTEFTDFMKVDQVLIENQPSLRNPTMKTLATILYSYFVIRGITDATKTKSTIKEVRFVSPSNKLKVNKSTTEKVLKNEKEKECAKVYKMTKKLGEKYCKSLICPADAEKLSKIKKKDDMCDAFLQGFQWLFSPIPKEYFDKLATVGFDEDKKATKKTSK